MKIIFITDSYGGLRIHNGVEEVTAAQTYPELVKAELSKTGHQVDVNYAPYRRITDIPDLLKKYQNYDLYIIQVGVVDIYPRTLSYKYSISQRLLPILLRRIIRKKRSFFIKYVHNKPWTSEKKIIETLHSVCRNNKTPILWINTAPVNLFQQNETPGANEAIKKLNELMHNLIRQYPKCYLLDIHALLVDTKHYEDFMHPKDSHLNIAGNEFYAKNIFAFLNQKKF
jgi:hypothetical protein